MNNNRVKVEARQTVTRRIPVCRELVPSELEECQLLENEFPSRPEGPAIFTDHYDLSMLVDRCEQFIRRKNPEKFFCHPMLMKPQKTPCMSLLDAIPA